MSGILALDLARKCGFAWAPTETLLAWPATPLEWHSSGPPAGIFSGVHKLPDGSGGRVFRAYDHWLSDAITDWQPDLIVIEGPGGFVRQAYPAHLRFSLGLVAHTERVGWVREVRVREVPPASVKKRWTGSGKAKKPQMVAEARARGFEPIDDNHADALAILDYAAIETMPRKPDRAASEAA